MPLFATTNLIDEIRDLPCTFSSDQVNVVHSLPLPVILIFKTATKYDTKRINTELNVWEYSFAGSQQKVKFIGTNEEIKIKKYILASFVNKNSPTGLAHFNSILTNLLSFSNKSNIFSFGNSVEFLEKSKNSNDFYFCLYAIRALCVNDFPEFSYDNLHDLEFVPRPANNSWLSYQNIDNVLSMHDKNMISKGIKEISTKINKNIGIPLTEEELIDCSILGLCYTCGIRPVQVARLAVEDLRIDTIRKKDDFKRYSISMPYAKQQQLLLNRSLISIPPELAEILLEYQRRSNKKQEDQFFDVGATSSKFVSGAINRQMMRFAPKDVREAINNNFMIQPHYSAYDFRHNVGHSLAMSGASADEIAHILGHSSLVVAKHYIMATPELALIRARALGTNPVWQTMISMMLTGSIISKDDWEGRGVSGIIDGEIHTEIGGCSRSYEECPFSEVRSCYSCLYYHPFIEGDHNSVLSSINKELIKLVEISDSVGYSKNPLIQVQESTKLGIESVISRCYVHNNDTAPLMIQHQ